LLLQQKEQRDSKKADEVIYVPETIEETSVFLTSVVTQFFAYHCATLLGLDVDQPRNLAKSVTGGIGG